MSCSDEDKKQRARIAAKKYRENNKEKIKLDQKKLREKNKEKAKQYAKQYYIENKDLFQQYSQEYYELNKDEILNRAKEYYKLNKDDSIKHYKDINKGKKKIYNKEYSELNKEALAVYRKKRSTSLKVRFGVAAAAAKKRNYEFLLSFDEFCNEINKPCTYCNDYFRSEIGTGSGLDRIDNTLGYVVNNVCSCCAHCNYLKRNIYTPEQTKAMVKALIDLETT